MADQRTRHAEKRHGGDRNDRRVNTDSRTRTHGRQFFVKGRVFNTSSEDGSGLSSQTFLVIREAQESPDDQGTHCTCLSISPLRKDSDVSQCGVLHAGSTSPPSIKGVKFKPLQINVSRDVRFDAPMLVNYINMFNVDTNSQVNDIGKLRPESLHDFMDNFKDSLFDSTMDKDGRNSKQGRRKGKSEEGSNKLPHGYRDQSKPYSKGQIAPNTRSAATNASGSGSSTAPNGPGTEITNKRPKLRHLEVPQHTKRQKPKGSSSYDSDGWEDSSNSPTRTRAAENKKLQDTRNHHRKPDLPPGDQVRGTKDRHGREIPAKRAEEGEIPKGSSHADGPRDRGDERAGRPAINAQPHSPTKRNLNHRRDGEGVHKASNSVVPGSVPVNSGDSSDRDNRGRQRDINYPGASRDTVPSRREDARRKNDHLRRGDGQPLNFGSSPQSTDKAVHDGKEDYGSGREDNDGVDGRRGYKGEGPSSDTRHGLPPPTGRREIPQNPTSRDEVPSDRNRDQTGNIKNEHSIPGNDNTGRPSDIRAKPDPRSMAIETTLPNKARPDELHGRHRKVNPTTGSGQPGPSHRSQMANNPPPSGPRGRERENSQSDAGNRQMRLPEFNTPYQSEPGRSNYHEERSVSPRGLEQPGGSSGLSGSGTGGGGSSRSSPPLPSRGGGLPPSRGPSPNGRAIPDRDDSPGRNLPPLDTPGSRSPSGDFSPTGSLSPMREESPLGESPGSSSVMPNDHESSRGSPGSSSPGNSMAGDSPGGSAGGSSEESPNESPDSPQDSPVGSEMVSPTYSPVDSMKNESPLDSTQEQSPIGDSSYHSPMSSEPASPSMTERSRSLSPPPRRRSQYGEFSPASDSPGNPGSGGEPEQDRGGVRRRGPKRDLGEQIEEQSNQDVDNEELYINDDGCCGNGFLAWCKSVLDWWNGVGQEEWIQMDDQKDKGRSRQNFEEINVEDKEDSCSVASGLDAGSCSSWKNPFGDGEEEEEDESTVVDDGEEDSDDDSDEERSVDHADGDSDDENGSDQEDSDDDTYTDSEVESNDETEEETGSENSSTASSRRSSTAVASEVELDHQDSSRQSPDHQTENSPENNYPTNNQHIQTPQDIYSYAPNDDRSYMGQHNYPSQNTYTTNPNMNNIPPQELETAYQFTTNPSSKIPPNTAELATDNNDPHPPPYTHIPSTPHQLSRPRSTRFELASERDPVELDVPSLAPTASTTRGKSELFLPPSLTPGLVTPSYGAFPSFSARTLQGWNPYYAPPLLGPGSETGTGTASQNRFGNISYNNYQPQMQAQPALREPMNYPSSQMARGDGSARVHGFPHAPRYDERNVNAESGSDSDSDEDSDLDSGFGTYDDDLVGRQDDFHSAHYSGSAGSSGLDSLPGNVDVSASTHIHTPASVHVTDGYYGKDNTLDVNANANAYTGYNHTPPDQYQQYTNPPYPVFLSSASLASLASSAPSRSIYNTYHGQREREMLDKSGGEQVAGSGSKQDVYGGNVSRLDRRAEKARNDAKGKFGREIERGRGKEMERRKKKMRKGEKLKKGRFIGDSSSAVGSYDGGRGDSVTSGGSRREREREYESGSENEAKGEEEETESEPEESDAREVGKEEEEVDIEQRNHNPDVNHDEEMNSDGESLAPLSADVGAGEEKKEKRVSGSGKGEKGRRSERGDRRRNGGRERERGRKQKEGEGVDVSGKLKKTWEFLKKLDYHEN